MEKNIGPNKLNLRIHLNEETLKLLRQGNYKLTIYKGIDKMIPNLLPTVWCSLPANDLLEVNDFTWSKDYEGFISRENVVEGVQINPTIHKRMNLGDKLTFNDGIPEVTNDNTKNTFTIENDSGVYTAGISAKGPHINRELFNPICAVLMDKKSTIEISPKEKLLVAFTTNSQKNIAACIEKIHTEAATIEYFEGANNHEIFYDFDSKKWQQFGENIRSESNGWFRYVRMGAGILNKILNG